MAEPAPPAYALHRTRRLRDQCRAFRESLPEEHRAAFDELLRDSSNAVKAGAGTSKAKDWLIRGRLQALVSPLLCTTRLIVFDYNSTLL